ncbi:hypothetical protein QAD02_014432 [Eretmocerus hayati]|uniref:Uncharacterized protein n=1 Tax=Eretmocerus hayati TaxID=131215 RepID=A0ACC2PA50_9HYME|nr:hypothetical protein QAD02_014432 [Eretmocerus hayati]
MLRLSLISDLGTSNCSWTSCREGCTRELFECTQIRVNYKLPVNDSSLINEIVKRKGVVEDEAVGKKSRSRRSLREYDYIEDLDDEDESEEDSEDGLPKPFPTGLMGNDSEWYFTGAKLFPNVKGCGYPPMLNCTIFVRQYGSIGQNFSCYYSKIDPGIVISDFDIRQVYRNLIYAMAIPIPSFIISVIYLTIAYFKIYNEDEVALVGAEENAQTDEAGAGDEAAGEVDGLVAQSSPGALTPSSDAFREDLTTSFGHQYEVAMVDDVSRGSLDGITDAISIQGSLSKTMTTSISTHPGPTVAV